MNSIRQKILEELGWQLSFISTANGYRNTLPSTRIHKGYKSINEVNEYPAAFYHTGAEKIENNESYDLKSIEAEVIIGVYIQSSTGQGKLTDESEEWINDLKRFIAGNKALSKTLNLYTISGVEVYYVENITPYIIDHGRNIGGIVIEMKIKYNESTDDEL